MRGFTLIELLFAIVFWVAVAVGIAMCSGCSGEGIIVVEGFPHGVAFCEDKYSMVIHRDEAHVWNDKIATYVINRGHYSDPQVAELVKVAHRECAKYYEN